MFDALYLSPHFDDAVLSCGGNFHRRVGRGERVLVVTVFAAPPPNDLSPFAQSLHARWSALQLPEGSKPSGSLPFDRAQEDRQALKRLGAECVHLNYHDCIYRRAENRWLYDSEESLWGDVSSLEMFLVDELAKTFNDVAPLKPNAEVWCPFAIGDHVDHKLVKLAASAWGKKLKRRFRHYADYPYAESVLGGIEIPLSDSDRQAKIESIRCYSSQISTFWEDDSAMVNRVSQWTERAFE
ncbi:MAG: PIG-L family deacetylase [Chloroflexi bacterium]|nr:PIG-L family deacetylase [Chloroflexota bacterium]